MRRSLEQQVRELEEKRRAFESEKISWEQQTGHSIEELRRRSLEANSKEWVLFLVFYNCRYQILHTSILYIPVFHKRENVLSLGYFLHLLLSLYPRTKVLDIDDRFLLETVKVLLNTSLLQIPFYLTTLSTTQTFRGTLGNYKVLQLLK